MNKVFTVMVFGGLIGVLAGCGPSAQERAAQEQQKAVEQQKLLVEGFADAAKKTNAEAEAHPDEKLKPIDWNSTLHPNKK